MQYALQFRPFEWLGQVIVHSRLQAVLPIALQGDRENCLQAGMNDYLAKPFKRAELQRILQRWIGSQPELPVTSNETGRGEPE